MNKYISKFITFKEYECSCCSRLPPEFYYNGGGRVDSPPYLYRELFNNFKTIREKWGRAINISSGYRCLKKQKELYDQGISNSILSSHSMGLAMDLDCIHIDEVDAMAMLIKSESPELRIGIYKYRMTFVHIDTAYRASPILSRHWKRGVCWHA